MGLLENYTPLNQPQNVLGVPHICDNINSLLSAYQSSSHSSLSIPQIKTKKKQRPWAELPSRVYVAHLCGDLWVVGAGQQWWHRRREAPRVVSTWPQMDTAPPNLSPNPAHKCADSTDADHWAPTPRLTLHTLLICLAWPSAEWTRGGLQRRMGMIQSSSVDTEGGQNGRLATGSDDERK